MRLMETFARAGRCQYTLILSYKTENAKEGTDNNLIAYFPFCYVCFSYKDIISYHLLR